MKIFTLKHILKNTSIVWLPIGIYFLLTGFFALWKGGNASLWQEMMLNRLVFIVLFVFCFFIKSKLKEYQWQLVSFLCVYAALSGLYKETASLNQLFLPALDETLVAWDEYLFGFQPSVEFSKSMSSAWFSELMFMGYFWYYLMPLWVLFIIYKKNKQKISEFGFLLIASFITYYLFFITNPAFGPQFYFSKPFSEIEAQGLFGNLVKIIQKNGEAPTAAFPSSHIGISWVVLIWLFYNFRNYILLFLPFVILLMFSTVYIKAHYAVDAIFGWISAFFVYFIVINFFRILKKCP